MQPPIPSTISRRHAPANRTTCPDCGSVHLTSRGGPACTAHSKHLDPETGRLVACTLPPVSGYDVCRMHGGNARRGALSPTFKNASKAIEKRLPQRYMDVFRAASVDPNLISLRRQISMLDAREIELYQRLSDAPIDLAALRQWLLAAQDGHPTALDEALKILDAEITDASIHEQLAQLYELRRRLSDTERRRVESTQAYMTAEEISTAGGFFASILRRYVKDPADLRAAGAEMSAFFDGWKDPRGVSRAPRTAEHASRAATTHAAESQEGSEFDFTAEVVPTDSGDEV